jgi:hypothetical protein
MMQRVRIFVSEHSLLVGSGISLLVSVVYGLCTDGVINDDAYIFFQYARNLAETGLLSFNPGEQSFGVTSILWTLLLTFGTLILGNPIIVAKIFGALLGAGGTVIWARWLFRDEQKGIPVIAIALAALWPTIGADSFVIGMENALLCFLTGLALMTIASDIRHRIWLIGGICGLLLLARPEMLVFVGGIILFLGIHEGIAVASKVTLTALLLSFWWPLWLYKETGALLPPTMVGKMSVFLPEHLGITIDQFKAGSMLDRMRWGVFGLIQFAKISFSSIAWLGLLGLAAGTVLFARNKMPRRQWYQAALAPVTAIGFMALFAYSFPLLQLRYFLWLSPALVFTFYISLKHFLPYRWLIIAQISLLILFIIAFPGILSRRIESTQIQQIRREVGETLQELTPQNARIALEPIGAVGYYSDRYIVDMGGLINTNIQPCLKNGYADTSGIWHCLNEFQADYLVTYDHDGFLGRLPLAYPDRFEFVRYIPETPLRNTRYRLLRIIH